MREPVSYDTTLVQTIRTLRERWPETPFLALGQTALWDEPTKAVFRRALDTLWPDARLIAGAHDTDYFAKLPAGRGNGNAKYTLFAHDDARTRGLWSAAGEMSRFFGSEDVPTVADLRRYAGVEINRALFGSENSLDTLSQMTTAWGWTGIVHTESTRKIAADIPLKEILPALLEQMDWAMTGSLPLVESESKSDSIVALGTMRGWIGLFAEKNPDAALTDLYRDLYPRFYEMLLGMPPANLATTSTLRLLRFNTQTANLPRFAFVDLFLNRRTRQYAENAYNLAVAGSDIYTLDQFGDGALPFDLVIPQKGRGTLFLTNRRRTLTIDTPQPITLESPTPIESIGDLASWIETCIGGDCALVGKAVSLLPLLCAEHFLLFHEGASGYSDRTRAMLVQMRRYGIQLPELRPVVRLRYATWDALATLGTGTKLHLPEHLAQSFGRSVIDTEDFGNCWQYAQKCAQNDLQTLLQLRSPRKFLTHLARTQPDKWQTVVREYDSLRMKLVSLWHQAQAIQGRIYTLYDQIRLLNQEVATIERQKSADFHRRIQPLREAMSAPDARIADLQSRIDALQAERSLEFDAEIASRRAQVHFAKQTIRELTEKRHGIERGEAAKQTRLKLRQIDAQTEQEKVRQAKNALQTVRGLNHTNYRPSAWWFPLVDPSGKWLARVGELAQAYLEPMDGSVENH